METHKFTAVFGKSNPIVSVQAPDKDTARQEIDRQLQKNPQRREIWRQWQADGGHIILATQQDPILLHPGPDHVVSKLVGALRGLLAELDLRATRGDISPEAAPVFYAIERARDALKEYDWQAA